ncbi:MAG: hypothetical protein ABFE01_23905 [Phycisphaerales bacterium]
MKPNHMHKLEEAVTLAGWPTPNAGPQNDGDTTWEQRREALKAEHKNGNGFGLTLGMAATLAGWNTPRSTDGSKGGPNQSGGALPADAAMAGWATPASRDHKDGACENADVKVNCLLGRQAFLSPAVTGKSAGSVLNPAMSRWLMGFPAIWDNASPHWPDWSRVQGAIASGV